VSALLSWLKTYESVAIWLEGIALVLIFVWDRIDAHQQYEESREQIEVFRDQVEATQRPFLVFLMTPRDSADAILGMDGATGEMMLRCPNGVAALENIGSGPAVNASYSLSPLNPASTVARPRNYLVTVAPGQQISTSIPRGILQGNEWDAILAYESLSGRKYKTTVRINNLVPTNIRFEVNAAPVAIS
jgi:hypothetical protein